MKMRTTLITSAVILAASGLPSTAEAGLLSWCANALGSAQSASPSAAQHKAPTWGMPDPQEPFAFRTVSLDPVYLGEEKGTSVHFGPGDPVHYANDSERAQYRITIKNGFLFDAKGQLFSTFDNDPEDPASTAIYVMDSAGKLYAHNRNIYGTFHHSTMSAGLPVAASGEIVVKNGVVLRINRASGHYKPSQWALDQLLLRLQKSDVPLREVEIGGIQTFDPHPRINAPQNN